MTSSYTGEYNYAYVLSWLYTPACYWAIDLAQK